MALDKRRSHPPIQAKKRRLSRADTDIVRWLILVFPIGLMMMWNSGCKWRRRSKLAISGLVSCVILAIVLPITNPTPLPEGGVRVASKNGAAPTFGPGTPENLPAATHILPKAYRTYAATAPAQEDTQGDSGGEQTAQPTQAPVYVYINAGGKYYHTHKCRYRYDTTPSYALTADIAQRYDRCKDCKAPKYKAEVPG